MRTARSASWDAADSTKRFTHPLDLDVLSRFASPSARVVDCGCGYGRLLEQLSSAGWTGGVGVDFAEGMLRRTQPEHRVARSVATQLPLSDASVDVVLAFAVLTCVPEDSALQRLVEEWRRVLRPGGVVVISDCALGSDARNLERHELHHRRGLHYGAFDLDEGVRCRHFAPNAFEARLSGFDVVWRRALNVTTMNGNAQPAFQLVARRGATDPRRR